MYSAVVGIETEWRELDTTRCYEMPAEPTNSPRHAICSGHGMSPIAARWSSGGASLFASREVPMVCCGNDSGSVVTGKISGVLDAI